MLSCCPQVLATRCFASLFSIVTSFNIIVSYVPVKKLAGPERPHYDAWATTSGNIETARPVVHNQVLGMSILPVAIQDVFQLQDH